VICGEKELVKLCGIIAEKEQFNKLIKGCCWKYFAISNIHDKAELLFAVIFDSFDTRKVYNNKEANL